MRAWSKYIQHLQHIIHTLSKVGAGCTPGFNDGSCASGICEDWKCTSAPQAEVGDTCRHSKECKSRQCNNDKFKVNARGVCFDYNIANNEICLDDDQCMYGKCASVAKELGSNRKKCGIEVSTCKLIWCNTFTTPFLHTIEPQCMQRTYWLQDI